MSFPWPPSRSPQVEQPKSKTDLTELKSRCWQSWIPLEALERSHSCCSQLLEGPTFLGLWPLPFQCQQWLVEYFSLLLTLTLNPLPSFSVFKDPVLCWAHLDSPGRSYFKVSWLATSSLWLPCNMSLHVPYPQVLGTRMWTCLGTIILLTTEIR
jgi:hypothetical protein